MDEFRDELRKYVDQTEKLNDEVFELKQRLVEQEHRHAEEVESVREQYVSELETAKDNWREQALKYGQQQRIMGREESNLSSFTHCNKTIEYGMKVNSSAASNDAIVCNALIASARFTVALIDFDVSDHHISIVNTTNIDINLNGCYIVLDKSGDRFDIEEDIVLRPQTKCSIWWVNHNSNSEHTEPVTANTRSFRHCAPTLSLFWNRTGHNHEHPEHNRTSISIAEVAQLFDSSRRRICQAVTNQAMFSVYYDYQIRDMSAHFTAELHNGHRVASPVPPAVSGANTATGVRSRASSSAGAGAGGGVTPTRTPTRQSLSQSQSQSQAAKKNATPNANANSTPGPGPVPTTASNQPAHPTAMFPHVHYTRQNTLECIRFVEESDVLLTDYASDLLGRLDRFSKRSAGNMQLCGGLPLPGSEHHHSHDKRKSKGKNKSKNKGKSKSSRPSTTCLAGVITDIHSLPPKSCTGVTPVIPQYNMSMCHVSSRVIDVEALLAQNCITIENLCAAGPNAVAPVDLHPNCTVSLICNSNTSESGKYADSISFQLGRHVMVAPGQRAVLVSSVPAQHPSHVLPIADCAPLFERLHSMSAAMHKHCVTDPTVAMTKNMSSSRNKAKKSRKSKSSDISSGSDTDSEDTDVHHTADADTRVHNVQLGFLTLSDQHDNLLFCASVVQAVDISKTAFTAHLMMHEAGAGTDSCFVMPPSPTTTAATIVTTATIGASGGSNRKRRRSVHRGEDDRSEGTEQDQLHRRRYSGDDSDQSTTTSSSSSSSSSASSVSAVLDRVSSFVAKIFE